MISVVGRGKAGRALSSAMGIPCVSHETTPAGLVILAVPDDAIVTVAARFEGLCVHLSGSLHLDDVPCAHPLISFDGEVADWTGTPLAITGAVPEKIRAAFEGIGFVPFELSAEHKALYHATAVLTSGHAATLWLGADRLLRDAGIELPGRGLWPLARATLDNVHRLGPPGRTGPFVRGDETTIARDADALPEAWREVFLALGRVLD